MRKLSHSLLKLVICCIPVIYACGGSEGTSEAETEVIYSGNDQINSKDKESLIDRNKKMILLEQEKIDSLVVPIIRELKPVYIHMIPLACACKHDIHLSNFSNR